MNRGDASPVTLFAPPQKVFRYSRAVIAVTTGTGIALYVPRDDTGDEAHVQRLRARPASAILS
jgi:hypothetical protein